MSIPRFARFRRILTPLRVSGASEGLKPPDMTRGDRKMVPPRAAERWWMQLPLGQALAGSKNCTESSNSSRSATQSEVQRNPPGFLLKLREMGAIPHLLRSNRTGERVLLIAAGKLCRRSKKDRFVSTSVTKVIVVHSSLL